MGIEQKTSKSQAQVLLCFLYSIVLSGDGE